MVIGYMSKNALDLYEQNKKIGKKNSSNIDRANLGIKLRKFTNYYVMESKPALGDLLLTQAGLKVNISCI